MSESRSAPLRVIAALAVVFLFTGGVHQLRSGVRSAPDFPCSVDSAGDVSVDLGITLKDSNGIPTLLRNSLERITVSSTIAVGSTETLTVTKGKLTAPGSVLTTASRSGTPTTNTFLESTDSLTASTGSYDLHAKHSGSTWVEF